MDVGAAPGSWSQVLSKIIFEENSYNNYTGSGYILGLDLQVIIYRKFLIFFKIISPVENVDFLSQADITKATTQAEIRRRLENRKFNAILSDMAPSPCGLFVKIEISKPLLKKNFFYDFSFTLMNKALIIKFKIRGKGS